MNCIKIALVGIIILFDSTGQGLIGQNLERTVKFASSEKARELLATPDSFTDAWSKFDIDARMGKMNSEQQELLNFAVEQVREWEDAERKKITSVLLAIDERLASQKLKIDLPEEIFLVKTTALEEGGAVGYTRANYIVLKGGDESGLEENIERLIIHELFHVLTRINPAFRKKMYAIIGFELMNKVDYPDDIKDLRITNPDAPQTDSYITLMADDEESECMMVLYSEKEYDGGNFFEYVNIGFLKLEGRDKKKVAYANGEPVIYSFDEVGDFFEQVGNNTRYIIHPEEILADNFAFAVLNKEDLPNPEIVDRIRALLTE